VQRYHDRVAARYDHSYDDAFWKWHDALTWDYIKPYIPRIARAEVIDLGCGTGKWGAKLVAGGFGVTSLDISAKMLDQARARIEPIKGNAATEYVQADLCDLSALPAERFSLALAMGDPIGCTDNPLQALKEIRRILTAEGILVATFDNRYAAIDFHLQQGTVDALSRFLRDGRIRWLTKNVDEQFPIQTLTAKQLGVLVERAGLEVLKIVGKTVLPMRHHRHLLEDPAARRAWARVERRLSGDPEAASRASHFQIACRRSSGR
jgi:SAM-dependent methyltransferase